MPSPSATTRLTPPVPKRIAGLTGSAVAWVLAQELRNKPRTTLIVVPDSASLEQLVGDLRFIAGQPDPFTGASPERPPILALSGWEVLPFDALSPAPQIAASRIFTLGALAFGKAAVVVATVEALMQRVVPRESLLRFHRTLAPGASLDRDEFVGWLDRAGYVRNTLVEEVGQMAVRGAVVDLFPPGSQHPLRVELFGDSIDSLRLFDSGTQRSLESIVRFDLLPVRELLVEEGEVTLAVRRLHERTSELGLPRTSVSSFEAAVTEGFPLPGLEQLAPVLMGGSAEVFDYLSADAEVVLVDEPALERAADDFEQLIAERAAGARDENRSVPAVEQSYLNASVLLERLRERLLAAYNPMSLIAGGDLEDEDLGANESASKAQKRIPVYKLDTLRASLLAARRSESPFRPLAEAILERHREGIRTAIVISHRGREKRIAELLRSYEIDAGLVEQPLPEWIASLPATPPRGRPMVSVLPGTLSEGLRLPEARVMLIPEAEIFPELLQRAAAAQGAAKEVRRFLGSAQQLQENDYIVHVEHGIAIYRGLKQLTVEGKVGDFLALEYADDAKLFVPVENIGRIQKYAGVEGKQPQLSKLGGKAWVAAKRKVKEHVAELAGQLLTVLAERELAEGVAFDPPGSEDSDFAETFPFEETPDQARAIADVLRDMSSGKPMDRLVCGDVGYGKTEVALRAAFKAVHSGMQVAFLVPTTVLADQHFASCKARFEGLPITVACVSRFQTPQENRETLARLAEGKVDIVVGTHRLLQKDVFFKDLGLVVIDEEHRFGVAHKERLKRLRSSVHVLTLTATPIPRTLHMSLVGIRDLSVIETPPTNRQVIRTYLANYTAQIVREAIKRELGRSGQVFYIHNRVENIESVADEVRELVPEARVDVGHGQMREGQLEEVMHRFVNHETDVLVSTTIVESGLDIPNANTIIIRNADRFGLAELYQLRGRVGRSSKRAYAYLLIPDPKRLGVDAKKRLQVLQSLDDLGVGFRLALQDMEIRGAGNLLGRDQSGQISAVGFDLYSRILKEAVYEVRAKLEARAQGDAPPRPTIDPDISIGFPANIPRSYVPDVGDRLLLYQRLIDLRDESEAESFAAEIEDRFGQLPEEVVILLEAMVFRSAVRNAGIIAASCRRQQLSITFHPELAPAPERLLAAVKESGGAIRVSPTMAISMQLSDAEIERPKQLMRPLQSLLHTLGID